MKKQRVLISVSNDLVTDNRVHKVATSLQNNGFEVLLIGRKFRKSSVLNRTYQSKRFSLIFNQSALFYAEFNIRLFIFLLFSKVDILLSNDLDTLVANFLISKIRNKKLVYDSHELFTEVPELVSRPKTQNIWLKIEKSILPKIKNSYTVCASIANYYNQKYGIDMQIVRNVPFYVEYEKIDKKENRKVIIYQGAVNIQRGLEEIIYSMDFIDNCVLWIIGDGDITKDLKKIVHNNKLEQKVVFIGRLNFEQIWKYTIQADLGISIEKNSGLNYYFALPNKIFDYIQAQVPILCSDFPEMKKIIDDYNVGSVLKSHEPKLLAQQIQEIFSNSEQYISWKKNLKTAKKELCWQNEEKILLNVFK